MIGLADVDLAGLATALGLDGMRLLETPDPVERAALVAVTHHALKWRSRLQTDDLSAMLGGGS